jgi:hypothetical protein
MTPCRERIVAALAARLATITVLPGLVVERDRAASVSAAEMPLLAVYEGDETPQADFTGERAYTLSIAVEGYATGATPVAAAQAASDLRAQVDKALFADVTLGGIARNLEAAEESAPARLDLDAVDPCAGFTRVYRVDYAIAETDPYTFA